MTFGIVIVSLPYTAILIVTVEIDERLSRKKSNRINSILQKMK